MEVTSNTKIGSPTCEKCGAELLHREGYWCRLCASSHMEESDIGQEHIRYKRKDSETVECPECGYSYLARMLPGFSRQIGPTKDLHYTRSSVASLRFPHLHVVLLPLFLCSLCVLVIAGIIVIFGIDFPWPVQVTRPLSQGGGTYTVEFPWIIVGVIMIFALISYLYKKSIN